MRLLPSICLFLAEITNTEMCRKNVWFENSSPQCGQAKWPANANAISQFRKVLSQFSQFSAISFAQPCTWWSLSLPHASFKQAIEVVAGRATGRNGRIKSGLFVRLSSSLPFAAARRWRLEKGVNDWACMRVLGLLAGRERQERRGTKMSSLGPSMVQEI